jgi:predicted  nucleic acid-binding Zn-ribbon protein
VRDVSDSGDPGSSRSGSASVTSSRRVKLVLEPSPATLCLGVMASAKFCTRVLSEGATSCGAASHARKFQPPPSSAFVKDTEVRAYCSPVLDLAIMSPAQRLRIQGVLLTATEWTALFQQVAQRNPPKWLAFEELHVAPVDTVTEATSKDVLSPTNIANGGLLAVIPMLSFDESSTSSGEVVLDLDLADVAVFIRRFKSHFSSLKAKWARAFTEVESGYGLLVQDLEKLHTVAQDQSQEIGTPVPLDGTLPLSLWKGLKLVHESVSTVASAVQTYATSLDALAMDQTQLSQSVLALETQAEELVLDVMDKVATLTVDLRALENRVLRLVPLLQTLKRSQSSSSPALGMDQGVLLTSKLEACEQSVKTLRQVVETLQDRSKEINVDASSLDSRILALQTQMKQLQLKVVGKGVQIVNKTFQSFDDVKAWVDLHLPNHCYGLFVDGVSIFEFFAAGHVDAEKTYSAFYSQHRTGFKSTFEARIASSVQN